MSASVEEQLCAVRAQIGQLQAADLPSALQGLLQQARTQLKPPSRGAAAAAPAPAAAARPALVLGLLLVLERAAVLAQQQRSLKLVKDAHSQLTAAFQQHDWLWQLLLRKHLPDLLQHPAAAQRFLGALAALPASTQARAYRLWHQQLAAQPAPLAVPPQLQQLLLEQLRLCFTARSLDLGLVPAGSEPLGEAQQQDSAAGDASVPPGADSGLASGTEVQVSLREQLPHLLQQLLLLACSGGGAAASDVAPGSQHAEGGSSGHGSANGHLAPSLSTVQSAVPARRDTRRRGSRGSALSQAVHEAAAEASTGGGGASGASSSIQDSVLRHAVLLVGHLSDPDALHEMLGIQLRLATGCPQGSASDGEEEEGQQQQQQQAAAEQQGQLSRRDAERVSTAAALIEVCLDGMLTLPPLAEAVHQQLHSKGNSNAAAVEAASAGEAGGAADAAQQQQDAAAELRTTAGLMLGMHRELSRLLAEQQQGVPSRGAPAKRRQPALLSLAACQQLLCMLAEVQPQPSGAAGSASASAAARPPALLLVPPQLAVQGIELVRQAVEAGGPSFQPAAAADAPSWRADMAARAAAIYAACYQAIWGAKVLQSAEAYQLLLSAARLRRLLRPAGSSGAAAPAAADDEAAAEVALLAENAVGNRRRRQRSAAHELPSLAGTAGKVAAAGGAPPAAKRIKTEHNSGPSSSTGAGSAVAELLQLFSSPAPGQPPSGSKQGQQQQGQKQAAGRKRIQPVPVVPPPQQQQQQQPSQAPSEEQQQQQPAQPPIQEQQGKPARKRIVPQQVGPATCTKPASAQPKASQQGSDAPAGDAVAEQQPQAEVQQAPLGWQHSQQRVVISKAAARTEEEQEELWASYIADKEFLAEMLGDADYQRWFDESAHPLRKQRQRPGGLEAAWAAVLGGRSAGSIVQQQLPRTLLEASVSMRWDAAAAACLQLLGALLRGAASAGRDAGSEAAEVEQLLLHAFSRQQREAGAHVATRVLGFSGQSSIMVAVKAARGAPIGASLVLLSAQMLGLARGHDFFQRRMEVGAAYQGAAGTGPAAEQGRPLSMTAQMVQRLLRLPPPLQHMLAPGCAALLRVAAADVHGDAQQAVAQHAALLWMLVQQGQACQVSEAAGVELPADCPSWLEAESLLLERSSGTFHQHRSSGHALLLGPAPEVQRAAVLELLQQLRLQLEAAQQQRGSDVPADELVAAADACHAAMQRLVLEHQARQRGLHAAEGGSDASSEAGEDDEEEQGEPLLLGSTAAAEVAALAAAVCRAGAAAAATVAAALDAAATCGVAAHKQHKQQQQGGEAGEAAAEAASMLVLCNQLLEPADCLLQSGCLPPAAQQQLEAACEQLDGQGQAVDQLARGLREHHPLLVAVHAAMAEAPALWQPAGEEDDGSSGGSDSSSGEEGSSSRPAGRQHSKAAGGSSSSKGGGGKGGGGKGGAAAKPKGRSERRRERRRRMRDVCNPAVRAMLTEDGGAGLDDDDLSDLEDFLVFNPERDYGDFFKRHFWQARGSDSEEEEEEQEEEEEGDGGADEQQEGRQAGGGAAAAELQQQRQRQRPPAKARKRGRPPSKQQQPKAATQQRPAAGIAAADVAAAAAAAAKQQFFPPDQAQPACKS